jgi:photosystem II stability/assembly factor-like uncharacterized protein
MKRLLAVFVLAACGGSTPPPPIHHEVPPPELHPVGDWHAVKTEVYKGKQDDIYFVSAKVGFYGNGAGKIYRTDDGGETWTQVLAKPGTYIRAVGFLDDKRGFAGNIGPDAFPGVTDTTLLYRTDDGGASWRPVELPDAATARGVCAIDILALDAVNAGHRMHKELGHVGGRVGGPASLHASDNGGETWKRLPLPPEVAMILDVKFLDANTGFVFAGSDPDVAKSNGLIAKTVDSGRTWKIVYRSKRPFELMWKGSFPSRAIGYASLQNYTGEAAQDPAAHITPVPDRFVVKTTDGGDTWAELPVVQNPAMQEFGIGFVDERRGWIGALPTGFATEDGGATWKPVATMPLAANKLRIVHDGAAVHVWAIGLDVRHLDLAP